MIGEKILSNAVENLSTRAAKEQGTLSRMFTGTRSVQAKEAQNVLNLAKKGNYVGATSEGAANITRHAMAKDMEGMGKSRAGAIAARNGVALAALGAGAVGARYATGGTATTNRRGERDIAGIPFM